MEEDDGSSLWRVLIEVVDERYYWRMLKEDVGGGYWRRMLMERETFFENFFFSKFKSH